MKSIGLIVLAVAVMANAFGCGSFKNTANAGEYECVDYTAESALANVPKDMTNLVVRDEMGNLKMTTGFKNGLQNGETRIYYFDGKLKSTMTYIDGVKHGDLVEYWPNGNVMVRIPFVWGDANGKAITYTESNSIASIQTYVEGTLKETFFYDGGEIIQHAEYTDQGTMMTYYVDGEAVDTMLLEDE